MTELVQPRSQAGFTLMELLVALAVLGFLFLALTQGSRLGLDAWDRQSKAVAARDQLDSTDRALRMLLSRLNASGQGDDERLAGAADHLDFRTELPADVALATRQADATLFVDPTHRLMLRWRPHLHEQVLGDQPPSTDTELLAGVERLQLSYWEPRSMDEDAPGWHDSWHVPAPPSLIKIHLVFAKSDPRHWPDIVVAPALDLAVE